jgi:hypothetical protein
MTSPHDDLARLRTIAEEGRRAPLLGGAHLLIWGAILTVALLFNWAVAVRLLPLPPYSLAFSWFGLVFLGWLASSLIARRQAETKAAFTVGNRIESLVWTWAGAMLAVLAVAILVHGLLSEGASDWTLFAIMSPVSFGVYAMAIGVSAAIVEDRAAIAFAVLSLAFAGATTLLIGRSGQLLAATLGVGMITFPLGLRQLARARRPATA